MVDILKLQKTLNSTFGQVGALLGIAAQIAHRQPEQFSEEVVALLRRDATARQLLVKDLDVLAAEVQALRLAISGE
jgi:hypothetical protein